MVLVDSPPALTFTDAAVVSKVVDGAVVVVSYGKTRRAQLEQTVQTIEAIDANVLGVVINQVPAKAIRGQGQYYYYANYSDGSGVRRSGKTPQRHRATGAGTRRRP
jgi:Mrp family chromosome partitioning ATPase